MDSDGVISKRTPDAPAQSHATYRLVRYADDFVVVIAGTRAHAEALLEEIAEVLTPMGLRLSEKKTVITHIDEGFDFLGFRIQRRQKPGTQRRNVYTWPSKTSVARIKSAMRTLSRLGRDLPLSILLYRINPVLRGWTNYFRYGVSAATFNYLRAFIWRRVVSWIRHKHPQANWRQLRRRYLPGWWPTHEDVRLIDPSAVTVSRYRYRGRNIPTPWSG